MNRPLSDIPDIDVLGQWALTHWLDAPLITLTTNQGEIRYEFVPENAAQRDGVPYIFEMPYVLTLYEADQADKGTQRSGFDRAQAVRLGSE